MPSVADGRQLLGAKAAADESPEPGRVDAGGRQLLLVPEIHELLSEGDEVEGRRLSEPVSSGFFDDRAMADRITAGA